MTRFLLLLLCVLSLPLSACNTYDALVPCDESPDFCAEGENTAPSEEAPELEEVIDAASAEMTH